MKKSSNETSTLDAELARLIATLPAEPAASNVIGQPSLRMRSGIKAGAFNRGGGVYG